MTRFIISSISIAGMILPMLIATSVPSLGADGVIHACLNKFLGTIRIVSDPSKCRSSETAIDLQKAGATAQNCPDDMVKVGPICVDKYEASVWSMPPDAKGNPQGTQFEVYPCSPNGNDCSAGAANPIYAVSAPGVTPSSRITWFQAQQACANVGKRLLRNGEWQMVAAGTPDPGDSPGANDCNTLSSGPLVPSLTGSRSNCVSNFGVFDMVGNLGEWVEDWIQPNSSDGGSTSTALYGMDKILGINDAFPTGDRFPAALFRGGFFADGSDAGVFALNAFFAPSVSVVGIGFRCAR